MLRFGFVSFGAYVITIGYIVVTLLALFISYYYIAQIDWENTFIKLYGVTSSGQVY